MSISQVKKALEFLVWPDWYSSCMIHMNHYKKSVGMPVTYYYSAIDDFVTEEEVEEMIKNPTKDLNWDEEMKLAAMSTWEQIQNEPLLADIVDEDTGNGYIIDSGSYLVNKMLDNKIVKPLKRLVEANEKNIYLLKKTRNLAPYVEALVEKIQDSSSGKVYIASMNMRGEWAKRPENTVVLNVTSAQPKTKQERLDFSPMTCNKYKGYSCFENYWQSGKVIQGIDKSEHDKWWKKQTSGKRRYPGSKGMRVLHSNYNGVVRDYIESRKQVYVPEYRELIRNKASLKEWIEKVKNGVNVVVYDFDGPRLENGQVDCQPVTRELLREKINDPKHPFGHGYIVAGLLAGIEPSEYL